MSKNLDKESTSLNKRLIKGRNNEQMVKLDETDKKILKLLISDARLSHRKIADHLNLSVGTIIERLRRMHNAEVIEGYKVSLNPNKLGYEFTAIIEVITPKSAFPKVGYNLTKYPGISVVYSVTGDTDYVVIARFKSVNDLNIMIRDFSKIPNITRTETLLVLETFKEDFTPQID